MQKDFFYSFENDVMNCIIMENTVISNDLLKQYHTAKVINREFTKYGFYTKYEVNPDLKLKSIEKAVLGNVQAKVNNLKNGVGFALYITNGLIDTLEGYTYDECFPDAILKYKLIT